MLSDFTIIGFKKANAKIERLCFNILPKRLKEKEQNQEKSRQTDNFLELEIWMNDRDFLHIPTCLHIRGAKRLTNQA